MLEEEDLKIVTELVVKLIREMQLRGSLEKEVPRTHVSIDLGEGIGVSISSPSDLDSVVDRAVKIASQMKFHEFVDGRIADIEYIH